MRLHFSGKHVADWVPACDSAGIKITAAAAQDDVEAFRRTVDNSQHVARAEPTGANAAPEFSRDAFIDLIVEWVVADDQVSIADMLCQWLNVLHGCPLVNQCHREQTAACYILSATIITQG